jgi:prevent-host-death family protein
MKAHQSEHWLLAEAKNRFSEVTRCAFSKGPQTIFRRAGNVVVISEEEYLKLKGKNIDFKHFLLFETPDLTTLDLTRDASPTRDIEL